MEKFPLIIHEGHMLRKRNRLMRRTGIDFQEILQVLVYVILFAAILLVYGLSFRQSLALAVILSQFYLILFKIHYRIRR